MANELALLSEAVYALRENFTTVAVDRGINFDKEAGFALQILGSSDFMMNAAMNNRQSVENAVTNVAAIGISLNPALKQAYLVVRKGVICLDLSYMGLIHLAISTGSILWAQANVVREHDNFIVNGFDKPPTHGHDPFAGAEARGRIKGAYVVVKTCDGEYLTHTMDIDSIYSIRDRSEAWKSFQAGKAKSAGPWASDEIEMIKKTVVKQAQKYWPKTDKNDRVEQAIAHLNTEGGEGFEPINNTGSKFDSGKLQKWIDQAQTANNDVALSTIWTKGLAEIKPSKDMAAYNKFKEAVVARGSYLKANAPVDVTPKPKTFEQVMEALCKVTSIEQLHEVGVLLDDFPGEQQTMLYDKYDELKATLEAA